MVSVHSSAPLPATTAPFHGVGVAGDRANECVSEVVDASRPAEERKPESAPCPTSDMI